MKTKSMEFPWYKGWFDENYLILYDHRDLKEAKQQVKLILSTLNPKKSSIFLDLACGEGRYMVLFKKLGYRIVGLDLSESLLRYSRAKYPHLDLIRGDMRAIPGKFDIVLSLFTSFGYFNTKKSNMSVLHSIYCALNDYGVFWLDFLNKNYVETHLVQESRSRISSDIEVIEHRKIKNGRIIKDIYFRKNGDERTYKESVYMFSREQLEGMFNRVGFKNILCFGDYSGSEWTPDSPRTIMVGRKGKGE
jgi:SAM-dependent methyltransferase